MPLSERLKAEVLGMRLWDDDEADLLERAVSVCALVEAFQAAEQARKQAEADYRESGTGAALDYLTEMCMAAAAAKARLLEVNLG